MPDLFIVRLVQKRLELGWSQRRVALHARIGHGHLSRIEAGHVDPKISTVRALATVLGVPF